MFDYCQISNDLTNNLSERTKDVISRRFGLSNNFCSDFACTGKIKREPLEAIGKDYKITRERVRQIESDGIARIKKQTKKYDNVFSKFEEKIKDFGGFKREDIYLSSLGDEKMVNHIFFLLNLGDSFFRFSENKDFHSFWAIDPSHMNYAQEIVGSIHNVLEQKNEPLEIGICKGFINELDDIRINSCIEISKHIHKNTDGFFGLKNWPGINPKSIKDKAYLVLKKEEKPLHFKSVALLIGENALSQTVHNELIKDSRFILVGRGIYALKEWGYKSGEVKDIMLEILKESKKPLTKQEIIDNVAKQRIVKKNTIIQNLSNKNYFSRTSNGCYIIKKS